MKMKHLSQFFTILLTLSFLMSGCTRKKEEDVFVMGFTPAENAETVLVNGNSFTDIIKDKTGVKFKAYVASDYTALIEALRGGKVHFAWIAPFGLILSEKRAGGKVLLKAVRNGKEQYYGCIFVRKNKPFKKIQDLKGRSIAWVDPASTSGYIIPKVSLMEDGIDVDNFFGKQVYAGAHDSVLLGVLNGSVDAGASFTNEPEGKTGPWDQLAISRKEYAEQIRVLYVTKPIPNEIFTTTDDFYKNHKDIVEKVSAAIQEMHKYPEGKKVLADLYKIDSMVPAKPEEFEVLRKAADKLNLKLEKLK